MKYRLFWTDATLAENYQNEQDLIATMRRDGVEVEITANDGGWYDYEATHNFEADNDKKALEYIKDFDFNGRNVDVFTLSEGKREVATEENLEQKERLEYLRGEIEVERISYLELAELQSLSRFIEPGDVLLEEWAGVPEGTI